MDLVAGHQLDDHLTLRERLGAGGLGEVWTADHSRLGAEVAVKVLLQLDPSSEALARFQREARAVAQLGSPYTVQVFDFGVSSQGRPYIVMERLRGEDLHHRIERLGPMPLDDVALVVEQVCAALDTAHRAGIVHRDIKPANVFLVETGAGFHVKVLDFGIAKQLATASQEMTSTGAMLGTPYYMSPEQLMDPKRVGPASDLWSVAVMIYAALCGTLPFHGETVGALSVAIHQGHFTPLNVHRPDLPHGLMAWMQRALTVEPSRRYPSAVELSRAFQQAVHGGHGLATAPTAFDATAAASHAPAPSPPPTSPSHQPVMPAATTTSPVAPSMATASPAAKRPVGLYAALTVVSLITAVAIGALVTTQRPSHTPAQTDDDPKSEKKKKRIPKDEASNAEDSDDDVPEDASAPAPNKVQVRGRDPLVVMKQLSAMAKKKRPDSHLVYVILNDVTRSGMLTGEGSMVVVHYSPSISACITVIPVDGEATLAEGTCVGNNPKAVPLPRCSLSTVRDKASEVLPDVPVDITYIAGPGGVPTWQTTTSAPAKLAQVPDDCP